MLLQIASQYKVPVAVQSVSCLWIRKKEAHGEKCLCEVHQLISTYGAAEAKKMADSKLERQCFDAGAAVMQDDRFDLNVLHSGFAMTGLPHKSIKDLVWERAGGSWRSYAADRERSLARQAASRHPLREHSQIDLDLSLQ
jgi:hypothetical protein